MGKTKVSRAGQARVSQKIRKLIHEGYGPKQAAAIAYKMEHEHQLGPRGSTSRLRRRSRNRRLLLDRGGHLRGNPIPDQYLAECLAALSGLLTRPDRIKDIRPEVLDVLFEEGLWSEETGVTQAGVDVLEYATRK